MYAYGEGVPEDPAEAFAWFSAAAEQGVPGAEEEKEFVAGRMDRDQALRGREALAELLGALRRPEHALNVVGRQSAPSPVPVPVPSMRTVLLCCVA